MRFRLSSVFLSFLIMGLCLAWAMDHISAGRINLVGTWRYPNDAAVVLGYWSRLTFHRDGKFEKEQKHRTCSVTYSGTYTLNQDGELVFHVTARSFQTWLRKEPQTKTLDDWYHCRCAVDRSGYLLIKEVGNLVRGADDTAIVGGVNDRPPSDQAADDFAKAYALKWEVHQRCN